MTDKKLSVDDFLMYYPTYKDDTFNVDFMSRKETHLKDFKSGVKDNNEKRGLLFHQKLLSNYMSSFNLNDNILLCHGMGSGKTFASISIAERIRKEKTSIDKVYFFAKNELLLQNFKSELLKSVDPQVAKSFYRIQVNGQNNTYMSALTSNSKLRYEEDSIEKIFSNSVIILDEVHNLKKSKGDKNLAYDHFHTMLHIAKNCKIILLSGTPMIDQATEIIDILNLILPLNEQLNVEEYFDENGKLTTDSNKISEFKSKIKGRVSFLKNEKSNITTEYTGTPLHEVLPEDLKIKSDIRVEMIHMSNEQIKLYKSYEAKNSTLEDSILQNISTMLIFDVKTNSYIYTNSGITNILKNNFSYLTSLIKPPSLNNLDVMTRQIKMLENLKKISPKLHFVMKTVLDCKKKGKCVFIHSEKVEGIGIHMIERILNIFDYRFINRNNKDDIHISKYWVLGSQKGFKNQQGQVQTTLKLFNSEPNYDGKKLQVIIGSDKASEGFNFYHIQHEIILYPWWNFSKIEQIIARGIRRGSHQHLIENNPNWDKKVKISLLCSVDPTQNVESIDYKRYKSSFQKDIEIQKMYHILKISSYDCKLFENINKVYIDNKDKDYSRDCHYNLCDYTCDIQTQCKLYKDFDCNGKNVLTYNLYHLDEINSKSFELTLIDSFLEQDETTFTQNKLDQYLINILGSTQATMPIKTQIKHILNVNPNQERYTIRRRNIFPLESIKYENIFNYVKQKKIFTFSDISNHFIHINDREILFMLNNIIYQNIIFNHDEYLHEENNTYYLGKYNIVNLYLERYNQNQEQKYINLDQFVHNKSNLDQKSNFDQYIGKSYETFMNTKHIIINSRITTNCRDTFTNLLDRNKDIKYIFSIIKKDFAKVGYTYKDEFETRNVIDIKKSSFIQTYFKNYLHKINPDQVILTYFNVKDFTQPMYIYNISTKTWTEASHNQREEYRKHIQDHETLLNSEQNKISYYGKLRSVKGNFYIVQKESNNISDIRTKSTGRECLTKPKQTSKDNIPNTILDNLKEVDSKTTKSSIQLVKKMDLCIKIFNELSSKYIKKNNRYYPYIIYDFNDNLGGAGVIRLLHSDVIIPIFKENIVNSNFKEYSYTFQKIKMDDNIFTNLKFILKVNSKIFGDEINIMLQTIECPISSKIDTEKLIGIIHDKINQIKKHLIYKIKVKKIDIIYLISNSLMIKINNNQKITIPELGFKKINKQNYYKFSKYNK